MNLVKLITSNRNNSFPFDINFNKARLHFLCDFKQKKYLIEEIIIYG